MENFCLFILVKAKSKTKSPQFTAFNCIVFLLVNQLGKIRVQIMSLDYQKVRQSQSSRVNREYEASIFSRWTVQ